MTIETVARRLHTHTVVFESGKDIDCAVRAMLGQTTKGIAADTGLSMSQVQYRISKAMIRRSDYRSGESPIARQAYEMMRPALKEVVEDTIAPRFAKLKHR